MFKRLLLLVCCCLAGITGYGQVVTECPQNVGFERGAFDNWECYYGQISQTGDRFPNAQRPPVITLNLSSPSAGIHTLIKRSSFIDEYGGFSLNAPNGSGYVVQLGNNFTGRGAERISYTINVPSNVDAYSVIFSYAVVFQNPNHDYDEQPKFTARVFDVTTNSSTDCGSFEVVAQGGLPGFRESGIDRTVLYRSWSPVLVNLSNYLGHTIRLEFTTNDCTRGGHFGYAYIDFNENCSIPVTGNITCPETEALTLNALPGFFEYRWFDVATSEVLGTSDNLVLSPVPPLGTRIGIELVPYPGLGCTQTLYTVINGMEMNIRDPLPDCKSVNLTDISLKVGNSSDLTYTYWRNSLASIPIPDPKNVKIGGVYYVKGQSSSGCSLILPVTVTIIQITPLIIDQSLQIVYPGTIDLTRAFSPQLGITYSYWLNREATIPLPIPTRIGRKGTYYIKSVSTEGCSIVTDATIEILIPDIVIPNTFTPNSDGVNDVLTVLLNSDILVKHFRIFNRWGEVVYTTLDINNFWSGFRESTEVPVGVYYWVLQGDLNSKKYYRSGSVTLIR